MKSYDNSGRILERVCYASKSPVKAKDICGVEITVSDTFPYNPDSKTSPKTAKEWAMPKSYDYKTKQYVTGPEPVVTERYNDPFAVSIIDLDVRSQGGRAYKVIDEENRRFDLREDQVLEVFRRTGVHAGGQVPGQFVWGISGSQVKMILVGGELHTSMLKQARSLRDFKNMQANGSTPSESTFQFGHVYRKRDQSLHVFLGRVKLPGSDKTLCAFVMLPEAPRSWENCDLDDVERYSGVVGDYMRDERATAKKWPTMPWLERCQWSWYDSHEYLYKQYKDQVEPGYYDSPGDIVLLTSPKFEAEVSENCLELAGQLRSNVDGKHKYVNGRLGDIAEELYKANNASVARNFHYLYSAGSGYSQEYYRLSFDERQKGAKEWEIKVRANVLAYRMQFRDQLVWS